MWTTVLAEEERREGAVVINEMKEEDVIDGGLYRLLAEPGGYVGTSWYHNLLIAHVQEDKTVFCDTYWLDFYRPYELETIRSRLEFVFDLKNARDVTREEWECYADADRTNIPVGMCPAKWYVAKSAQKSVPAMIVIQEHKIEVLRNSIIVERHELAVAERELERLQMEKEQC
jgi:hypothetical protein